MSFKKITSLLLIMTMLFAFTACAPKDSEDESDDSEKPSKTESSKSDSGLSGVFGSNNSDKSGNDEKEQANGDTTTYASEDGALSFSYPSSWDTVDADGVEKEFVINAKGNNFVLVTEEVPDSYGLDLQGYADLNVENLKDGMEVDNLEVNDYTCGANGYEAKLVSYDLTVNDNTASQKSVIMLEGEKGYILTYTSVNGNIEKEFKSLIIPILDTVSFMEADSQDTESLEEGDSTDSSDSEYDNTFYDEATGFQFQAPQGWQITNGEEDGEYDITSDQVGGYMILGDSGVSLDDYLAAMQEELGKPDYELESIDNSYFGQLSEDDYSGRDIYYYMGDLAVYNVAIEDHETGTVLFLIELTANKGDAYEETLDQQMQQVLETLERIM